MPVLTPLMGGLLLTLVEAIGDFSLKHYAIGGAWGFLTLGMAVYVGLAGILVWLFRHMGLAIVNSYWDATSNIMTMVLGGIVFKESYTFQQWIGMAVVSLGLILIGT